MTSGTPVGGVIHDIGFRHYTGPRLGRGWAFRSLLVETLRGVFGLGRPSKVKTMPWVLVSLISIPALVMVIVVIVLKQDTLPLTYTQYPVSMSLLSMMFVAGRAPYAISRDLRDGVMPLYLSRPMLRRDYVFAKLAGLSLGTLLFLAAPVTILYIGALLAKYPILANTWGWLGGILMATVLAILLSAIALAISAFTPRRGFGVAAIMTALILSNAISGILVETLRLAGNESLSVYFNALSPFNLVSHLGHSWFGVSLLGEDQGPGQIVNLGTRPMVGLVFTVILVAEIGACIWILLRRYKKVGRA